MEEEQVREEAFLVILIINKYNQSESFHNKSIL